MSLDFHNKECKKETLECLENLALEARDMTSEYLDIVSFLGHRGAGEKYSYDLCTIANDPNIDIWERHKALRVLVGSDSSDNTINLLFEKIVNPNDDEEEEGYDFTYIDLLSFLSRKSKKAKEKLLELAKKQSLSDYFRIQLCNRIIFPTKEISVSFLGDNYEITYSFR